MFINEEFLRNNISMSHTQFQLRKEEILNENASIHNVTKAYDIFLSHSYLDKELVYELVNLFNKAKYSVYVDWMVDKQLDRSKVNVETSATLRKRMDNCKSLAYVSTSNISLSKWCPWELGYVDGKKNGRCAILPVLKKQNDSFKGQEYLGLYPYIDYETIKDKTTYDFWVNDPQNRENYVRLRDWLNGKNPYVHN